MTTKYYGGYELNENGNMELEFNVLNDCETFTGDDQAYLIKSEVVPGSEAWETIEDGYLPEEGMEGLVDLNHITVSLSFLTEVYELACGEGAIDRPTTENDVAEQLRKLKAENEALKDNLGDYEKAVQFLDEQGLAEWQEVIS